jgi:hypothetical protein
MNNQNTDTWREIEQSIFLDVLAIKVSRNRYGQVVNWDEIKQRICEECIMYEDCGEGGEESICIVH